MKLAPRTSPVRLLAVHGEGLEFDDHRAEELRCCGGDIRARGAGGGGDYLSHWVSFRFPIPQRYSARKMPQAS